MTKPIVALDFPSPGQVHAFLQAFKEKSLYVKVGMELFYSAGPQMIEELKAAGHDIFLDLKLHDIPNTVKQAMKGLARLQVDMINVHASGGLLMMESALEGLEAGTSAGKKRPLCIAVTQLTSTSEEMLAKELLIDKGINATVLHFAKLAHEAGLDGIVSSALEVPLVKEAIPKMLTVTPGIRLTEDARDDQVRIVTPAQAKTLGSDFIVVGRSITKSKQPLQAYKKVMEEWRMN